MKYLSTFSGIGGFELGINKAYEQNNESNGNTIKSEEQSETCIIPNTGDSTDSPSSIRDGRGEHPTCIGYSEINKYADQIYKSKFPEHKNYGDITKINAKELPDFDLFVGGFPCQAFSIAGKRGGFDDTRGTLFFDCARILKEKQPRNFILENVKGLLSHDNGRTFKTIINTLTELGYCVEWQVLNAKNFGVPQNRERVFIVGHLGGIPRRKVFPIAGNEQETSELQTPKRNIKLFNPFDEKYSDISRTLNTGCGGPTTKNGQIVIEQLNNPTHSNDRVYGTDGLSPTLNTMQGGNRQPFIPENSRIRRLTPLECERLMAYPDGWTEGLSDTQRYKTLGNGIVSNVVAEVVKRLDN